MTSTRTATAAASTRRAGVYVRISRDREGAGLGVERQAEECGALARRLGWAVIDTFSDNDISAYSGKPRSGYRRMLADIESGRVDAVIAWHTDRLHRSPVELESYISLCAPRDVPTHCCKAGPLDLSTASGQMNARIAGSVAKYEVQHMVERQKAAKLQAARSGKFLGGRRAFGYESDGITVRPGEAAHVLDASRRVLHGESLGSIARAWNAAGITSSTGHTWTSISVRELVVRPRNAGLILHGGEVFAASWMAIVPEDVWRAVRVLVSDPSRRPARNNDSVWLGSGLFLCGVCGAGLRPSLATGGPTRRNRTVYRCKREAHLARVAQPVDEFVTAVVLERLGRPDAQLLLQTDTGVDTTALSSEAAALRVRLSELVGLFTDGAITAAQLGAGSKDLRKRITHLEVQQADAVQGSPLDGFANSEDVAAAWKAASVSRRKAVTAALMTVTVLPAPKGRRPGGGYFDTDSVRIEWLVS